MNTPDALEMGRLNRHKELMVFDWIKAAEIIRYYNVKNACVGLHGDWLQDGNSILKDGRPVRECRVFFASTWAEPELKIGNKIIKCYRMQNEVPSWDGKTYWPKEALDILHGDGK